jgi:hypothetical protein
MTKASNDKTAARRLALAVTAGFLLLAAAWTALFLAARHANVETVPLTGRQGQP